MSCDRSSRVASGVKRYTASPVSSAQTSWISTISSQPSLATDGPRFGIISISRSVSRIRSTSRSDARLICNLAADIGFDQFLTRPELALHDRVAQATDGIADDRHQTAGRSWRLGLVHAGASGSYHARPSLTPPILSDNILADVPRRSDEVLAFGSKGVGRRTLAWCLQRHHAELHGGSPAPERARDPPRRAPQHRARLLGRAARLGMRHDVRGIHAVHGDLRRRGEGPPALSRAWLVRHA